MKDHNIISITSVQERPCLQDFEKLMNATEDKFNTISREFPQMYHKIGPTKLEKETRDLIKSVCDGKIFKPEDVILVAGHSFPDIQAATRFGVEVKSTEKDSWTSTGSSIVESTRLADVESIYMLFGKLGSNPPEFRCRPYESVLKDIHVTHAPRYTIDMSLAEGETIFDRMKIPYDDFRKDEHKIDIVKNYYREKNNLSNNKVPQWWLGKESPVNLEIMRSGFDSERKHRLIAEMLLIFNEIITGNYGEAAAWLCTRKFIINPSFRDLFSAGGTIKKLNGKNLAKPYPQIVRCILNHIPYIKKLIAEKDNNLIQDIHTHWKKDVGFDELYDVWVSRIEKEFKKSTKLCDIDIAELLKDGEEFYFN